MNITKLKLENFRNYDSQEIEFNKGINVIYGDNAQGKTNILEAIFLCSMGKSFRTSKDKELIKINKDFAKLNIEYEKSDREGKIEYIISEKKSIAINGVKIKKLSELLGNINSIIFSPDDMEILKDGPQKRRKFLNMLISQLRPRYLFNLNAYNKTLEQRNNYLRQIKLENKSKNMLEIWNEKLANHAQIIYDYRREFVDKILNKIIDIHKNITDNLEEINIKYISDFKDRESYIKRLNEKVENDVYKGYTFSFNLFKLSIKFLYSSESFIDSILYIPIISFSSKIILFPMCTNIYNPSFVKIVLLFLLVHLLHYIYYN